MASHRGVRSVAHPCWLCRDGAGRYDNHLPDHRHDNGSACHGYVATDDGSDNDDTGDDDINDSTDHHVFIDHYHGFTTTLYDNNDGSFHHHHGPGDDDILIHNHDSSDDHKHDIHAINDNFESVYHDYGPAVHEHDVRRIPTINNDDDGSDHDNEAMPVLDDDRSPDDLDTWKSRLDRAIDDIKRTIDYLTGLD